MPGGGAQQGGLRKYIGVIKDSTTVGFAKVNSVYKELDIAIVRATNHVERPAKEKHVKAIFYAISAGRPRADVAYCIRALSRRLAKTHNWAVALKTLIVIHRALREVDPTFREELINFGRSQGHILNMSHFKDDSSANAWDYSAFVRAYALYLEERLECFRVLKCDIETDPLRLRGLDTVELLEQLPALQELLFRLLSCLPEGAAVYNFIIQLALSMIASESLRIYAAISDGTINLVDKFFEMRRHDAARAFEMYRRAAQQAEILSEFYEVCKSINITRGEKFVKIEQPPASFLTTMEEYVKDAPQTLTVRKDQMTDEKPKEPLAIEYRSTPDVQEASNPTPPSPPKPVKDVAPISEQSDLLGLNNTSPDASELDNKNALALSIVPVDTQSAAAPTSSLSSENGATSWELALVTAPSSNEIAPPTTKLAGGFDKLTLDSLYDEGARRANQTASYNPWEGTRGASPYMQPMVHEPFYAPNPVFAHHSAHMAAMAQQQQAFMQQQQMMLMNQQQHQLMNQQQHQSYQNPSNNSNAAVGSYQYGPGMPARASQPYTGFM